MSSEENRHPEQQPSTLQQSLDQAVQHHKAGDLGKAEELYKQILDADPNHAVVLHLLGVTNFQSGQGDLAVELISKSVAIKPDYAEAHNSLGNTFKALKKLDEAAASFQTALTLNPDILEAHNNLGNTLKDLGRLDEAVASYHKALAIEPDFAEAHNNLGNALKDLGRLDEAATSYKKALNIKPDFAEAHSNLGNVLKALGRLDEALSSLQSALAIKPDYAAAHSSLGGALDKLGRLDEAVASYHKALALKPDSANAWNNLKFTTKALLFSKTGGDRTAEAGSGGLSDAARATVDFAIQQFYLDGFRPHEADESFANVIAALPAKADEAIPVDGASVGKTGLAPAGAAQLPDKVVALLQFGRSGTGLLHSLIDGHPEISTLPSIYLRGFFNKGVWEKISAKGWRELPDRFADEFAVLFDADSPMAIPSRLGETPFFVGKKEGMTAVGENRNEKLSLDRGGFCAEALRLMENLETVDPMSFLLIVHAAFETVMETGTKKHLCFYHIHNPDEFAKPNFLRYTPDARLLMTVREPIQNCESSVRRSFKNNDYDKAAHRILEMLFDIDQVPFRMRESVGVRLEDMKTRPEATMDALSAWLGVKDSPSLYEMTAQGKKWWGDPSSPDYDNTKAMSPFDEASTKRPVGSVFSEKDQFVLRTLFYPFSVRFGYRDPDPGQFKKDLIEVRPLIDDMLDFEKTIAERSSLDHNQFTRNGSYQLLRAGLVDRWEVLNQFGDYPHMLTPLDIE